MNKKESSILVSKEISLTMAMNIMNKFGFKCLLLIDDKKKLFGSLSDGDIRKYLVNNQNKNIKSKFIANKNCISVINGNFSRNDLLKYFNQNDLFVIPEIDSKKNIIKVFFKNHLDDIKISKELENHELVIMAGGFGKRIGKFTEILPKALLPIKNKTIISTIIDSFNDYGIKNITVSLNDKSEIIKSYLNQFKKKFRINFIIEKKPLGTVGALSKLVGIKKPFFLTNCDIYSMNNKSAALKHHLKNKNDLTVIVSNKSVTFDYGICIANKKGSLKKIFEKPSYSNLAIIGQYILNPSVIKVIPKNSEFNMNQLLEKLLKYKFNVGVYEIKESEWIDIGQWNLYKDSLRKLE